MFFFLVFFGRLKHIQDFRSTSRDSARLAGSLMASLFACAEPWGRGHRAEKAVGDGKDGKKLKKNLRQATSLGSHLGILLGYGHRVVAGQKCFKAHLEPSSGLRPLGGTSSKQTTSSSVHTLHGQEGQGLCGAKRATPGHL